MPTSHLYQVIDIMELILFTAPQSILDVGVGFGKYGFLSREYLELWNRKGKYCDWRVRIDGIEAYEDYLTPVHKFIYDDIYIGNAVDILSNLKAKYDLILLIDVLEHFEYEQGLILLSKSASIGKNMIVSTPHEIGINENIFSNAFEIHKFQWNKSHFRLFKNIYFLPNELSLICYIGEKVPRLKRARVNRKIGRYFPFMIPIAKKIKSSFNE
jgi:hypothetical protein